MLTFLLMFGDISVEVSNLLTLNHRLVIKDSRTALAKNHFILVRGTLTHPPVIDGPCGG